MTLSQQASRLAFYLQISKRKRGTTLEQCASVQDYRAFLAPIEDAAQSAWIEDESLPSLSEFDIEADDFATIAEQLFDGKAYHEVVLPFPPPLPVPKPRRKERYFQNYVFRLKQEGDAETERSVEATYGRMTDLLSSRTAAHQQVAGLVVGRVQSGKTRNYVGLALKAADEGWNILVVLTSSNVALAKQTRNRIQADFAASGMEDTGNRELEFLESGHGNPVPRSLSAPDGFLYWGVAMKEPASLRRIRQWLGDNADMAHEMRILIVDDEADNASQNTTTNSERIMDPDTAVALAAAIRDEGRGFSTLAQWVEMLPDSPIPDEEGASQSAATLRRVIAVLQSGNAAGQMREILNDAEMRELVGLGTSSDADGLIVVLADLARSFFNATRGRSLRTAKTFCAFLRYALDIAMNRSSINAFLVDLMRRGVPGAQANPFARTAYVAYTATPFANILNERPGETPLYADFIQSLGENPKYFGIAKIFGADQTANAPRMDIVRAIPPEERRFVIRPIQKLKDMDDAGDSLGYLSVAIDDRLGCNTTDGRGNTIWSGKWQTMLDAIAWAFCAAGVRSLRRSRTGGDSREERWTTMLVNISQLKDAHETTFEILGGFLNAAARRPEPFASMCKAVWDRESPRLTRAVFDALFNSPANGPDRYGNIDDLPGWDEIAPFVLKFIQGAAGVHVHPTVVNSSDLSDLKTYNQEPGERQLSGDHLWILCGGNTISRGLTLSGLVCSYFDRFRPSSAVDTMTQMGRWFGYRPGYELLPRIWMNASTASEMKKIAFIESAMHDGVRENFDSGFSPSDESHHQEIFCYGRRLSGRDAAQKSTGRDTGTYGSTLDFRTDDTSVRTVLKSVGVFLSRLGAKTDSKAKGYAYPNLSLWESVSIEALMGLIDRIAACLAPSSAELMKRFVESLRSAGRSHLDVVLGEPQTDRAPGCTLTSGISVKCGRVAPRCVQGGIARFDTLRLYLPYYAMIPSRVLAALDAEILAADIRKEKESSIMSALANLSAKSGREIPPALIPIVGNVPQDELASAILAIAQDVMNHSGNELPPPIHQLLGFISDGYRNRSSSVYMAWAHDRANQRHPILQIQCVRPVGTTFESLPSPLCSFSFFWPGHQPDGFYAVSV